MSYYGLESHSQPWKHGAQGPGTFQDWSVQRTEKLLILMTGFEERHLKRQYYCSLEMTVNLEKDKFLTVGV